MYRRAPFQRKLCIWSVVRKTVQTISSPVDKDQNAGVFCDRCLSIDVWPPLSNPEVKRLDTFVYRKARSILGHRFDANVAYAEVEDKLKEVGYIIVWPSVSHRRRRATNFGHRVRHQIPQNVLASWRRPRDRPPFNLEKAVANDLGVGRNELRMLAGDRDGWQRWLDTARFGR